MSIKSKIATALAVVTVATAVLAPISQAEARNRFGGGAAIGAGIIGGLLVGGALAARPAYAAPAYGPAYVEREVVEPRRVCSLQDRYNHYGEYVRTVRVCRVVY